ncbi:MAG: ribosome maturation factor RimM [Sedimenticola sp.]|nr:ribosome maturation factor RimM [Sedimenticola sp.]
MSAPVTGGEGDWAVLGSVSGLHGVRGWVKVFSHTSPKENIFNYPCWYLFRDGQWREYRLLQGRTQGKGLVASLEGVTDRDQAAELGGAEIAVRRDQLPETTPDEYYWADLEGQHVITLNGDSLGRVDYLFETGANDVMVVKGDRQRLLPFVGQVIRSVDLEKGVITVDWDPDF